MSAKMRYELWRKNAGGLKNELENIKENTAEIESRFGNSIKFGTAGLRGIVGAGTNRMNIYTVGQAAQAVAQWVLAKTEHPKVAIAYDTRNDSQDFAKRVAGVLAANRISVKLFSQVTPTPVLAYYVRNHKCDSGIVITASHNPSNYNGFKVYEGDGGQLRTPAAKIIEQYMEKIDFFSDVKEMSLDDAEACGLVNYLGKKIKDEYLSYVMGFHKNKNYIKESNLSVVYTPLNGTGAKYLPDILKNLEVSQLHLVKEQMEPDGNFTTCTYPNPESEKALEFGLLECKSKKPDLFIATDPDADRVRIGVMHGNEMKMLSGNQMGILLLDYLAKTAKEAGTLDQNSVFVRTVVSSPMTDKVAKEYGVETQIVLTGFKNVAVCLAALEKTNTLNRFLFAYEESIGFLPSTKVWDKDGICCAVIFAQMCGQYKLEGKTLIDRLEEMYQKYGYYIDETKSYIFEGDNGKEQMNLIMEKLKSIELSAFGTMQITNRTDYSKDKTHLQSNLVLLECEDGTTVLIRPSGTEPKLKAYMTAVAKNEQTGREIIKNVMNILDNIIK